MTTPPLPGFGVARIVKSCEVEGWCQEAKEVPEPGPVVVRPATITQNYSLHRNCAVLALLLQVALASLAIMVPLSTFPLPLESNGPPGGYGWQERDMSVFSTTTAFNTGINQRDTFLGLRRCIICGENSGLILRHCHIIMDSEQEFVCRNGI